MGPTTELRRALKARFFPHAVNRGFVIDETDQPHATRFRRRAGTRVQIFDVQWDKYGRPRFALRFGSCPAAGLDVNGQIFPPDKTLPGWCADAGSLQPHRGTGARSWFRQDSTWLQRLAGRPPLKNPADVVDELLALFPELERYWASGEVGPHLRQWHLGHVLPSRHDG